MVRIVGIGGSLRPNSHSQIALNLTAQRVEALGAEVEIMDLRTVHAWVIPEQIAIGQAWKAFSSDGKIVDDKLQERFDQFAQSLVDNTRKIRGVL